LIVAGETPQENWCFVTKPIYFGDDGEGGEAEPEGDAEAMVE